MEAKLVNELIEKDAIITVRNKFALALDTKDWSLLSSLFAVEIDTDYSAWGLPPKKMHRDELVGLLSHSFRRTEMATQHIYANFLIDLKTDKAQCISNFIGQHYIKDFQGGEEFYLRAQYTDQLIKSNDGWKITGIKLRIFYTTGNPQILS